MRVQRCRGDLKDCRVESFPRSPARRAEGSLRASFILLSVCVTAKTWLQPCQLPTVCVCARVCVRDSEFWFVRVSFFRVIERRWPQEVVFQSFSSGLCTRVCVQLRAVSPQELPLWANTYKNKDSPNTSLYTHLHTQNSSGTSTPMCVIHPECVSAWAKENQC